MLEDKILELENRIKKLEESVASLKMESLINRPLGPIKKPFEDFYVGGAILSDPPEVLPDIIRRDEDE